MKEIIYKVFAKTDENHCITDIWSTGNRAIGDTRTEEEMINNGYVLIDEGSDGEIYGRAQVNYLQSKHSKSMYDEENIPNFKFDDVVKEVTPEEKEEWFKVPRRLAQERQEQEETMRDMMLMSQQVSFLNSLPDDKASKIPYCYDSYEEDPDGFPYEKDLRREYKGQLYKCLQGYKKEKDNPTQTPDVAVSLWVLAYNEEWPQWKQPTGSHDAYNTGDKVFHNDHKYTSNIDGNTTEPGSDERWWKLVE